MTWGYKLYCTQTHVTPPQTNLKLVHLRILEYVIRNPWIRSTIACIAMFLPSTMSWKRTRMERHILVLFVSTEYIACTREADPLIYETGNKRTRIGEYNKVWGCFRYHIFFFFCPPTTRLKTQKNMVFALGTSVCVTSWMFLRKTSCPEKCIRLKKTSIKRKYLCGTFKNVFKVLVLDGYLKELWCEVVRSSK